MSIKISIKKSPYDREERVSDKDIDMFGRYMKQKKRTPIWYKCVAFQIS